MRGPNHFALSPQKGRSLARGFRFADTRGFKVSDAVAHVSAYCETLLAPQLKLFDQGRPFGGWLPRRQLMRGQLAYWLLSWPLRPPTVFWPF